MLVRSGWNSFMTQITLTKRVEAPIETVFEMAIDLQRAAAAM
jgi:hypothetical protein